MTLRLPDRDRFRDRELARLFGVHLATIHRWRRRGVRGHQLGGYLLGSRWHSDREQVVDFLAAINRRPAPAPPAADRAGERVERELDRLGFGEESAPRRPDYRRGEEK